MATLDIHHSCHLGRPEKVTCGRSRKRPFSGSWHPEYVSPPHIGEGTEPVVVRSRSVEGSSCQPACYYSRQHESGNWKIEECQTCGTDPLRSVCCGASSGTNPPTLEAHHVLGALCRFRLSYRFRVQTEVENVSIHDAASLPPHHAKVTAQDSHHVVAADVRAMRQRLYESCAEASVTRHHSLQDPLLPSKTLCG